MKNLINKIFRQIDIYRQNPIVLTMPLGNILGIKDFQSKSAEPRIIDLRPNAKIKIEKFKMSLTNRKH